LLLSGAAAMIYSLMAYHLPFSQANSMRVP
jgi:hypothetical protein